MSRCYSFPPPGYEIKKESLIKSIKEKVKKDRKQKRKERDYEADRSKKHRHKRRRTIATSNKVDNDVEFLEKSCLTMELDPQNSSCDSTLHSNDKRPKQSQPLDDSESALMINKDQKKLHELFAPRELVGHPYSKEAPRVVDALRICQEKEKDTILDSSGDITRKLSKEKRRIPLKDNRKEKKPNSRHQETIKSSKKLSCRKRPTSSMAVQYLNLVENWVPPDRVENKLTDSEDEEWWLFIGPKRQYQLVSNQATSKPTSGSSSMLWPTARFLPEAGVHALPCTVPF